MVSARNYINCFEDNLVNGYRVSYVSIDGGEHAEGFQIQGLLDTIVSQKMR